MQQDNRNMTSVIINMFTHLFNKFRSTIPEGEYERSKTPPSSLIAWIVENWNADQTSELVAKFNVEWAFAEDVPAFVVSPFGRAFIFEHWFHITTGPRPDAPSKVKTINLAYNITFEDGTIAATTAVLAPVGGPVAVDDASCFTMLRDIMRETMYHGLDAGLAKLYKDSKDANDFTTPNGEDPLRYLFEWIDAHMFRGEPVKGPVDPKMLPALKSYLSVMVQCVRPKIPQPAQKELDFDIRGHKLTKPGSQGGWDV